MELWIARNYDGTLYLFREKPICFNGCWRNGYAIGAHSLGLSVDSFPEINFINSPQKVKIELV